MTESEIKAILTNALQLQEIHVSGDGSHFQVIAVDNCFADMSRLRKQQTITSALAEYIADNRIHALTVKTFTPDEWKRHCLLNGMQ